MLNLGDQQLVVSESTTAAGVTRREVVLQSDTILLTLWVNSITSGTLTVKCYSFIGDDFSRKVELFSFPVISAATTILLQDRAPVTTQKVVVEATYTGAVDYEIHARAIQAGLVDTRIVGASTLRMSQATIASGSPTLLIAASLTDRGGVVIKNWSSSGNVYIGATSGEASVASGWPLGPKDALAVDLAAGVSIYAIAETTNIDVRISEAGG